MSEGIIVSEKYGVNPSMDCCFWCGEPKSIILFGKLKDDVEAPKRVVTDYEPCDKCKEMFNKGIHVIGVSTTPMMKGLRPIGQTPEGDSLYPDSTYFVAREEYVRRIFDDDEETINKVLSERKLLMPSSLVHEIIEYNQQEDYEDEDSEGGISDSDTSESD